ncbi:hypothetical protein AB0I92_22915 [Micromonospora chalcea]|uniref:hypothetical protein n=1 Tax=Micromonospora chalcea TaxID=1874 RepID=UPI00340B777B
MTDNQAGSAALVLIAAAFFLMAVQGTPLVRLGSAESGVELERRRRRVQTAIERARQEDNPDVAAGIVEAAAVIDPDLLGSFSFRAELYTSRVALAIQGIGARVVRESHDRGIDLVVHTSNGSANVVISYRRGGQLETRRVREKVPRELGSAVPTVLITNVPLAPEVKRLNERPNSRVAAIVTWNDERDTPRLAQALIDAISSANPSVGN